MMDWTECGKNNLVKQVNADRNLASSLRASSANRLESQSLLPLNDTTASSKISLTYDALRELLEAVAIENGYKVYNHECYCAFLREILNESGLADSFDSFRKARNAVNYYGRNVLGGEAERLLNEMHSFIQKVNERFASGARVKP